MKINLTKKEYRLLLDMLYISHWTMHSHATKENFNPDYEMLREKFLSYSHEMESEDRIAFSKESHAHIELDAYKHKLHENFIAPYEEDFFWGELCERLAKRDLMKAMGRDELETMDPERRLSLLQEAMKHYYHEFSHDGVQRLVIDPSQAHHHHQHDHSCCDH